jgi:hypothetical protein
MRRALLALAVLSLATACDQGGWDDFAAGQSSYRFASRDVVVKDSNRRFIRLSPDGEPFELVYDTRVDGHMDKRGYRSVFSLTDSPLAGTTYRRTPAGVVVCRTRVAAIECGMALGNGGDQWSMLFPASRKGDVEAMVGRARAYLTAHTRVAATPTAAMPVHYRCADNSWLLLSDTAGGAQVRRPDLARDFTGRTDAGGRLYTSGSFALRIESGQADWRAPNRQPLPCFATGPLP